MPARAHTHSVDSDPLTALANAVPTLFDQSQGSVASHRKNIALLYRLFTEVSSITEQLSDGSEVLIGEKTFLTTIRSMVDRILDLKKGVTQADNILKFITAFVAYTLEKCIYCVFYYILFNLIFSLYVLLVFNSQIITTSKRQRG